MIKNAILIGQKIDVCNYTAQRNYYINETRLLFSTVFFYKTLKRKTVASWLKYKKIC